MRHLNESIGFRPTAIVTSVVLDSLLPSSPVAEAAAGERSRAASRPDDGPRVSPAASRLCPADDLAAAVRRRRVRRAAEAGQLDERPVPCQT